MGPIFTGDALPFQAVIFDFDGLLMDTETTLLQSWQYEWQQWGLTLSTAGFFAQHGGNINAQRYDQLAEAVCPGYNRNLSDQRRTKYREQLHQTLSLRPGISDWINQALQTSIQLAIASSSPRTWIDEHLARVGILDCFDVITTGDEVTRDKPDPEIYNLAVRRLGVPAATAVAVEDTGHGVTAAQAAGTFCIAIPNPHVPNGAVAHADVTLDSATELPLLRALERISTHSEH